MRYLILFFLFYSCQSKQNEQQSEIIEDTATQVNTEKDSVISNETISNGSYIYSCSVTNGKISLDLQQKLDEDKLTALGKPKKVKADTLQNADTHTGSIIITYEFENITLEYFKPRSSKTNDAWLMKATVNTTVWKTDAGIKIGNTSDDIILAYPSVMIAKDGKSTQNNGRHIVTNSGDDSKRYEFTIKNGKVSKIEIAYLIN